MIKLILTALIMLTPVGSVLAQTGPDVSQIGQTPVTAPGESQQISEASVGFQGDLQRFGANLFSGRTAEINAAGSLPPDYQLGPGDQLAVYMGGKVQQEFELAVTADGKLYVPNIGVIPVNGMTMSRFKSKLDRSLRQYYSNYSLDVMLVRPKQIGVSVIGEVTNPGTYTASALAGALDFLIMAQGPTPNGSLRNVQLYRRDSLYARIDLYDFILRPIGQESVVLQSGDRLYIPIRQASVDIAGEINREANYELNPMQTEHLSDLLELAGGFTDIALREEIKIQNIDANGTAAVQYADFGSYPDIDPAVDPVLCNNDSIYVFAKTIKSPAQQVFIYGEVLRTGSYPWQENIRVSDLILRAGGVTRSA